MFSPPDYSASKNFLEPKLGPWTVQLYSHRKPILDSAKDSVPLLVGRLLDVGCGNKPYASILKCDEHIGVDVEMSPHRRDVFDKIYDGLILPFPGESFDSVLCTEVLEHAQRPRDLAIEIARVLKPGGFALLTAPFYMHVHESPYDFQRFTSYGMIELAKSAELEVIWIRPRGGIYITAFCTIEAAYSNLIARRPFADFLRWFAFPFCMVAIALDSFRYRPEVASLGWQMLVQKKRGFGDKVS